MDRCCSLKSTVGSICCQMHSTALATRRVDLEAGLIAGGLLDRDVSDGGIHFAMEASRCAKFFADLDDAGMDWSPIRGGAKTAVPKAVARLTAAVKDTASRGRCYASRLGAQNLPAGRPST